MSHRAQEAVAGADVVGDRDAELGSTAAQEHRAVRGARRACGLWPVLAVAAALVVTTPARAWALTDEAVCDLTPVDGTRAVGVNAARAFGYALDVTGVVAACVNNYDLPGGWNIDIAVYELESQSAAESEYGRLTTGLGGGSPIDVGVEGSYFPQPDEFEERILATTGPFLVTGSHEAPDSSGGHDEFVERMRITLGNIASAGPAAGGGAGPPPPDIVVSPPGSSDDSEEVPAGAVAAGVAVAGAAAVGAGVAVSRSRARGRESARRSACDEARNDWLRQSHREVALEVEFEARNAPAIQTIRTSIDPRRAVLLPAMYETIERRWALEQELAAVVSETYLLSKSGTLTVAGVGALWAYMQQARQAQAAGAVAVAGASAELPPLLLVIGVALVCSLLQSAVEEVVGDAVMANQVQELKARAERLRARLAQNLSLEAGLAEEFGQLTEKRRGLVIQYEQDHARTQADMDFTYRAAEANAHYVRDVCGGDAASDQRRVLEKEDLTDPISDWDSVKAGRIRDGLRQAGVQPRSARPGGLRTAH